MIKELEKIKNCTKCELCKVRKQVVLGRGKIPADIFILLEAPAKNEDIQGRAAVGKAGKHLDELINLANLSEANIFIGNSCLCWTGEGNPKPTEEQLRACWENVATLLKLVNPKFLIPMGDTALNLITGKNGITKNRGKFLSMRSELNNSYEFKILPTFHPAAVIYDSQKKNKIIEDLAYVNNILYPEDSNLEKILVDSIDLFDQMCAEIYNSGNTLSVDLETTGLSIWKDKIIGVSFSCNWNKGYYVPLIVREDEEDRNSELTSFWVLEDDAIVRKGIIDIISHKKIQKTGQNLVFDRKFCKKYFDTDIENIVFDAQLAAHLLDENSKHDLGVLALKYTDLVGIKRILEKDLTKKDIKAGKFYKADLSTISDYGAGDAIAPYRLTQDFYKEIVGTKFEDLMFGISLPLSDVIVDMESRGIKIDREYLSQLKIDFSKDLKILEEKIFNISGIEFNLNSADQLREVLFKKLKLPKGKKTYKSDDANPKYSTDKSVLISLYGKHEIIGEIMKYRTISKLLSKEIIGTEKLMSDDGIIYGSFGITATTSGRLNSSNPNLQNISGEKMDEIDLGLNEYRAKIRPLYIPREGYLFLRADSSQIELRILAWLSQDPNMLKILKSGGDIHTETAKNIFNISDVSDEMRKKAKTMNFAIIYGLSDDQVAQRLGISKAEASAFIRKYFTNFYRLKPWMNEVVNFMRMNLYTENIFGRRRRFPNYRTAEENKRKAYERECINHHPQSIAGTIVQLAQIRCHRKFKEAHQLIQVHDELIFEISQDKIFDMKDDIINEMERHVTPFDIVFPVESVIEKRWSVVA